MVDEPIMLNNNFNFILFFVLLLALLDRRRGHGGRDGFLPQTPAVHVGLGCGLQRSETVSSGCHPGSHHGRPRGDPLRGPQGGHLGQTGAPLATGPGPFRHGSVHVGQPGLHLGSPLLGGGGERALLDRGGGSGIGAEGRPDPLQAQRRDLGLAEVRRALRGPHGAHQHLRPAPQRGDRGLLGLRGGAGLLLRPGHPLLRLHLPRGLLQRREGLPLLLRAALHHQTAPQGLTRRRRGPPETLRVLPGGMETPLTAPRLILLL